VTGTETGDQVGGVIGYNYNGYLYGARNSASVTGVQRVGGVIGYTRNPIGLVINSGDVTAAVRFQHTFP
jgi:hypothetical protein